MAIPAYYACLRAISEDSAKLPLPLYRRLDRGREAFRDHPAVRAIRRPNKFTSSIAFRETLLQHAIGFGDGFAEIQRNGRNDVELFILDPTRVTFRNSAYEPFYEYRLDSGETKRLSSDKVLHIHGLGWMGTGGYNVALLFRESLGAALATIKYSGSLWGQGAWPGGIISHPGALSDQALAHLRESFELRHTGAGNVGRWIIAEEGMTYNQLGIDPEKAQMIEASQFTVEDVARMFRMPLHKIGHLLRSTFSNIEHQAREYVIDTLLPWLIRIEQELDRKLLFEDEQDELYFKHNVMGLLRGDEQARSDYYTKMIQLGMTPNTIMELEELPPIGPEGDISYISMQLRPQTEEAREAAMNTSETSQVTDDNLKTTPEREGGRPRNDIDAYEDILVGVLEPMVRKECNAMTRAAGKLADRGQFVAHMAKFYLTHKGQIVDALKFVVDGIAKLCHDDDGISTSARCIVWAAEWCAQSGEELCAAQYPDGIDLLAEQWMTTRLRSGARALAMRVINGEA